MEQHLIQLQQTGFVTVVDGKPLTIGSHSKDPDAAWGPVGKSYAKGYKLHAVYGLALPRHQLRRPWDAQDRH